MYFDTFLLATVGMKNQELCLMQELNLHIPFQTEPSPPYLLIKI